MGQKQQKQQMNTINCPYKPSFQYTRISISVLSYNVLADTYTDANQFPYTAPNNLEFKKRFQKIIDQITNLHPDIGCFQEIDNHQSYLKEFTKLGYECLFNQRPSRPDGCLIIYLKSKFQKLTYYEKSLDKIAQNERLPPQFLRQNVYQILSLQHISSKVQLLIGNIHVYWNPGDEDVKFFQIANYLNDIENQSIKLNVDSSIFCGDFNTLPNTNCLNYILDQSEPIKDKMYFKTEQKFKYMQNFYKQYGPPTLKWQSAYDPQPLFTNYTKKFQGTLDHIFYHNCQVGRLLEIPDEEILKQEVALPNSIFPSDHLPIMADFDIQVKNVV